LNPIVTDKHVDPVAGFDAPDKGEHLVVARSTGRRVCHRSA